MAVDIPLLSENKPIVYVSSPLINIDAAQTSSNDYFVQLITFIVQKTHHLLSADVVVRLAKSTSSDDQVTLIKEIFSKKEKYSGVILSPVDVSHAALVLQSLIHTLADYKSLPIITIDKQITEPVNDIRIPSITSNWKDGGACAARLILRRLKIRNDNGAKNILYMPGLQGSEERIAGFTEVLGGDADNRFTLTGVPKADFTRETAKTRFIDYLKTNRNVVDFIFACNDEMALGIRDAIVEARPSNQVVQCTKVIGFDGTKEFTAAMDAENNDILLATVDVNLESQVDKLVEKIRDLFSTTTEYARLEPFSHSEGYRPREAKQFETMK
jgi:ABC-type sugar transport system substrate-binding protein